jgi:hypothetical protein
MLAALVVLGLHTQPRVVSVPQVPLGINYHLDYELDQTGSGYKAGKETVETGTLTHELGIQEGQERYLYRYKHPGNGGKTTSLVLTADKKKNKYSVATTLEGSPTKIVEGKDAYEEELAVTRHYELSAGDLVKSEEVLKTIAGVPCTRVETEDFIISEGTAVKCVYWYPVDKKKSKRVGWLEAEKYTRRYPSTSFEMVFHSRTTRIRFGSLTPSEGG